MSFSSIVFSRRLFTVRFAICLVGLFIALSSIVTVMLCWLPVPILDQWNNLIAGRQITWSWFFALHNEHRLVVPRLIFLMDHWLAHETGIVDYAAIVLVQIGSCLILAATARRLDDDDTLWSIGLSTALLFWMVQFENLTWGFQIQFVDVQFEALLLFYVIALRKEGRSTIALAVVLQALATYTLANGIVASFIAVMLALVLRRSRVFVAILFVAAVGLFVSYLIGYHRPMQHPAPTGPLWGLSSIVDYIVVEIGNPAGNAVSRWNEEASIAVARGIGAVVLGAFCLLAAMVLRRRIKTGAAVMLVAAGVFVILSAVLTALGRAGLGLPTAMAFRYATPVLILWVCTILLLADRVGRPAALAVSVPTLAMVIATQGAFITTARETTEFRASSIPFLLANVMDTDFTQYASVEPEAIDPGLDPLRAGRLSVFSDPWASWRGTALDRHALIVSASSCSGVFDAATTSSGLPRAGWRAQGSVGPVSGVTPDRIVLADARGIVVGYAATNRNRWLLSGHPAPEPGDAAWLGAFGAEAQGVVRAYALLPGGHTACPLALSDALSRAPALMFSPPDEGAGAETGGSIDEVSIGRQTDVVGWGLFDSTVDRARIYVDTNLPVAFSTLSLSRRDDVATAMRDDHLLQSGFTLTLKMKSNTGLPPNPRLCLWTSDRDRGLRRIPYNAGSNLCTDGR